MTSHSELLQQAKHAQILQLRDANTYSRQLAQILTNILKLNSKNENTPLLDKMTTIHQLNDNIDLQLQNDIALNFEKLMRIKKDITELITTCKRLLHDVKPADSLQGRAERVDQDLRICERTLLYIQNSRT